MKVHGNAALGPAGRLALVEAIESGMTLRAAAAALNVSPATACQVRLKVDPLLPVENGGLADPAGRRRVIPFTHML
jgi:hypothetical protein